MKVGMENGVHCYLLYFDGNQEYYHSTFKINSSIDLKTIQFSINKELEKSANPITIYFVDGEQTKSEGRPSILINSRENSSPITCQESPFLIGVLTPSMLRNIQLLVQENSDYVAPERYTFINGRNSGTACKECEDAKRKGQQAMSHSCLNDTVVVGFQTKVGPIARPPKACS